MVFRGNFFLGTSQTTQLRHLKYTWTAHSTSLFFIRPKKAKPSVITSLDVNFCSFLIFKQVTPIVSTNPKSETALMCLKSFLLSQSVLRQSSGMHSRITFPHRKSIFFHVWRWLDKKKMSPVLRDTINYNVIYKPSILRIIKKPMETSLIPKQWV